MRLSLCPCKVAKGCRRRRGGGGGNDKALVVVPKAVSKKPKKPKDPKNSKKKPELKDAFGDIDDHFGDGLEMFNVDNGAPLIEDNNIFLPKELQPPECCDWWCGFRPGEVS